MTSIHIRLAEQYAVIAACKAINCDYWRKRARDKTQSDGMRRYARLEFKELAKEIVSYAEQVEHHLQDAFTLTRNN